MRVLTPRGLVQCEVAGATWFRDLPCRALLSSPARRASETAALMAGRETSLSLQMVEGVHPAGMSEVCEALFETMGYGPLRGFFAADGGLEAFGAYAEAVCSELMQAANVVPGPLPGAGDAGDSVAIFGHAVFLNAIAFQLALAAGASAEDQDRILDMDLGETEGIYLDLACGSCEKKSVPTASALVTALWGAGITEVVFIRHANAAPLAEDAVARKDEPHHWKRSDQMRVLTPKGMAQCEAAGAAWFRQLPCRALWTSPARRASETAMRMAGQVESEACAAPTLSLQMVESIHPAGMSEDCESLFETMGYGPLRNFHEAEGGCASFTGYADLVCAEMLQAAKHLPPAGENSGSCLAIFGHAVFLNAIAFQILAATGLSEVNQDVLLDMDLGETQGIYVDFATGTLEKKTAE